MYLDEQRAKHQLTVADLHEWRPTAGSRGRRAGATTKTIGKPTTGQDDQQ